MKAYISVSFHHRKVMDHVLNAISDCLAGFGVKPLVFVDQYHFKPEQEKAMMMQVAADILACDFLIAETTEKGIGIGIEAGFAKASHKPVIYLRHKNAEHSTTLSGISDFQVLYADTDDLRDKLRDVLTCLLKRNFETA